MGISKTNLGTSVEAILNFITGKIPSSHNVIAGRDFSDAHPISAITGLQTEVDKVNSISVAQKTVNQKHAQCISNVTDLLNYTPAVNLALPFTPTVNNGIYYDETTKLYTLKANVTYNVESLVRLISYQGYMYYSLYDYTNSKAIGKLGVCECTVGVNQAIIPSFCIITPTTDINVGIRVTSIGGTQTGAKLQNTSYLNIQEVERTIIDPVEYVNTDKGIEDAPVGHILSFMGITPPAHYITCNGDIYNIVDYPYLSQHIKDQFGTFNYFGGDGINTFAVPDLRDEFLRGYHGDKTEQLSGEIGVHQNATQIPRVYPFSNGSNNLLAVNFETSGQSNDILNQDKYFQKTGRVYKDINISPLSTTTAMNTYAYTTRPTNTAVLYCIKYESTYFMSIQGMIEEITLWEGNVGTPTVTAISSSITLGDSYKNYDKLGFYYIGYGSNDTNTQHPGYKEIPQDMINYIRNASAPATITLDWGFGGNPDYTSILKTSIDNQLNIIQSYSRLIKVMGIKYKTFQN